MGEIRIKSGNLGESFTNREYTEQYRICLLGMLDIKPSTSYTISFIMEEGVKAYFNEYLFVYKNFTGTGQRQVFNITTKADIVKNASTWVTEYGWILCKNSVNNENPCNFREVMILEGTYTTSTIPPYEPYFLNRPAHQITNGQFVDIPTHHFINGRWQGELTSQSPLKFRADGEMLDWRIEGKTSGNLFDINSDHTSIVWDGKECFVIENDAIVVNQIRPGYMTGIYYDKVYTPGTYTFTMKQLATQSDQTEIRVVSSAPFVGGGYNDAYKAYTAALTKQNNTHYITIVVMEPTKIGFFINGYFSVNDKLYDIQIIEGTYTASTLPPYEPYGGVGDWDEEAQKYRIPVRVEGENLYAIPIGEDLWGDNVSASHQNNDGELVVVMGTGNDSGVYSRAGSTINAVHSQLSTGSWSVEIKADSPMNLRLGFQADGVQYIDITNEYQKFTFSNQIFNSGSAFIVYNRTGVAHTVYLRNFEIHFDNTTNLYTDHQLMDGDSIDFTTDQTAIPIATGNNTLMVDTAVQPSKVFVKFEG